MTDPYEIALYAGFYFGMWLFALCLVATGTIIFRDNREK
jgi:hypothetical protein